MEILIRKQFIATKRKRYNNCSLIYTILRLQYNKQLKITNDKNV